MNMTTDRLRVFLLYSLLVSGGCCIEGYYETPDWKAGAKACGMSREEVAKMNQAKKNFDKARQAYAQGNLSDEQYTEIERRYKSFLEGLQDESAAQAMDKALNRAAGLMGEQRRSDLQQEIDMQQLVNLASEVNYYASDVF